jgi:methyl-accepting chemotaxis protein
MRNTIGLRLSLGFLAMIVLLLAVGLVGLWYSTQIATAIEAVSVQTQQLVNLVLIETAIERAELSLQSSLVDRTDGGLARSGVLLDTASERVAEFVETTRGIDPELLDALRTGSEGYRDVAGAFVEAAREGPINRTQSNARIGESRDQLQLALDALKKELRESINATTEQARQAQQTSSLISVVISIVAVALGIVLAVVITRSITRPISYLVRTADKLSTGDLETPVQTQSKDEVGELAESLERMRVSLKAVMDRVRARST